MQKTNSIKTVHKHVFAMVVIAGLVCLWTFVIYPKIALGVETPRRLVATAGDGEVSLEWQEPVQVEPITGYRIYYSSDKMAEDSVDTLSTDLSYIVTGLENGSEYTFEVTTLSDELESGRSESATATPTARDGGRDPVALSGEPEVLTTSTTAVISWTTTTNASSQVFYGPTEDFSGNTEEYNTEARTTDHSVEILNLTPCAGYWYKVLSRDAEENLVQSAGGEFKTTGCKGGSEIIVYEAAKSTTSLGTTVSAKVSGRGLEAVVPANLKSGLSEVGIEALKLEKNRVQSEISTPSNKEWVGQAYSLKAFEDEKTELDENFDAPVEVTIDYTADDVVGLDPDSLRIYHYTDGIGWEVLSNCLTNKSEMTVTCETTSFSIFAVFGNPPSGGVSGNNPSQTQSPVVTVEDVVEPTIQTPVPVSTPNEITNPNTVKTIFNKNLWRGMKDSEVQLLQKFLNQNGFVLTLQGAGSPGFETDFFGPLTFTALIKFQEAHKNEILTPYGLVSGTGFFGPKTRAFINYLK